MATARWMLWRLRGSCRRDPVWVLAERQLHLHGRPLRPPTACSRAGLLSTPRRPVSCLLRASRARVCPLCPLVLSSSAIYVRSLATASSTASIHIGLLLYLFLSARLIPVRPRFLEIWILYTSTCVLNAPDIIICIPTNTF